MGETLIVAGGEGLKASERVDLKLEGLGMSDLISSAYGRAGHSANASATTLSSVLRLIRAPEKHEDDAESEIFNDPTQVIPKIERTLTKILKGGPSHRNAQGVVLVKRVIFPNATANKEITSLPQPVRRRKIRDHQRSSITPRKIEEALGGLLQAKKIEEQSYTGDTEPPVPKEGQ